MKIKIIIVRLSKFNSARVDQQIQLEVTDDVDT